MRHARLLNTQRPSPIPRHRAAVGPAAVVCLAVAICLVLCPASPAAESGGIPSLDSDSGPTRSPRRSHIQAVTEIAAAPRSSVDLGLRLTRASPVLRQQLALTRGAGLVVEEIVSGSRAEKAGFRQHDVLVMLDDQLLLLPEQFTALLEATGPDTPTQCTVLRGGGKIVIPLGRTPLPVATGGLRLRPATSALAAALPAAASAGPVDDVAVRPTGRLVQPAPETLLRQDPDCQIRVSRGDETRVVVTDPQGRVLFNGTIDTPEHRSRLPVSVRGRVEAMERVLDARPTAEIGRLDVDPVQIR
jgi:hypothetical protein